MKVSCIFLIAAVTVWEGVAGGANDGVLSGYLVLHDDTKCLNTAGTGVSTISSTTQTALAANCIRLYLVEGSATQMYKILNLADQTMKLKLVDATAPEFVVDDETEVQFSDGTNLVGAATAGSVTSVTDAGSAFLIQLTVAMVNVADCLTAEPKYVTGGNCESIKWYFIEAECGVDNCATCNVDALKCDDCTDGTHVVNDACEDCNVDNCDNCDSDPAKCDTCADGYTKEGDTCEEESRGSALTSTTILTVLAALVALKSVIYI